MEKIASDHKVQVVISLSHLEIMLRALRDFIMEQIKDNLEAALTQLKKSLDFDSTAIDHLHLALYSFQDAVITVLRLHSIKPHWMFALDNLVKSAVQAGIMILSPELGANLAGHERLCNAGEDDGEEEEEAEDMSTSGVSTVNSNKLKMGKVGIGGGGIGGVSGDRRHFEEVTILRVENGRLVQDLLETQKVLQNVLKSTIEDQNVNCEIVRNFSKQLSNMANLYERSLSQGYVFFFIQLTRFLT